MRFRLNLAVDGKKIEDSILPINYQYELSSWIYRTINSSDSEFACWLHNAGYINENRKFKLFTLGDKLSSVGFILQQIEKLLKVECAANMSFHTISPMIISKNTEPGQNYAQYLSPEETGYGDLLANNLVNKYVALAEKGHLHTRNEPAIADVAINISLVDTPRQKLIKIKAGNESKTFLKGFLFYFKLSAPVELMRIGYYGGFGEKNSLGFGCCEVMF
jgi:CRISPR-associated endoribonuclease Cas6